jgi:glucokinase
MIKLFARESKTGMPPRQRSWYAHVDGGGTFTRVTISDKRSGRQVYHRTFTSADFGSVDDIIVQAFQDAGGVPAKAVVALAGPCDLENGRVTLTNRPGWPAFSMADFQERTGVRGKLHNDVELMAADAVNTHDKHITVIKPGRMWPGGRVVVLTLSTGLNPAVSEHGRTFATEMGAMGLVPQTDDERAFAEFVARRSGKTYAVAGFLVDGSHSFGFATAWMNAMGERPSAETARQIRELERAGKGIGPAITGNAGKDPFCDRIIYVIGGFYGTYLRELMTILQPTGGVHLIGSVNFAAAELYADPRFSPFMERVNDDNLPFADRVKTFAIVINRDDTLGHRGAKVLANRIGREWLET